MKTHAQIEKMIEAVKAQYEGLPDVSYFGGDNAGKCQYVVDTLQRVIDNNMTERQCKDEAVRQEGPICRYG